MTEKLKHDRLEKTTLRVAIAGNIILAVTAGIIAWQSVETHQAVKEAKHATGVATGQLNVMQSQLDAMAADERPWIKVTIESNGPLNIGGGNLTFSYVLRFDNTGKSPARFLRSYAEMVSSSKGGSMIQVQDKACEMANWVTNTYQGSIAPQIVFPNDTTRQSYSVNQPVEPLKASFLGRPDKTFILPAIAGCVVYETTFDKRIHHTWFSFDVMRVNSLIGPGPQAIDARDVKFERSATARNDAD